MSKDDKINTAEASSTDKGSDRADRHILSAVLVINLGQSIVGGGVGWWAESTALMGAALDNLSDALVYGISLYAVGRAVSIKLRAARFSGWFLIGLSTLLLFEVFRRYFGGGQPVGPAMMAMAAVNASLNLICLRLLARHRGDDVNFKASSIFTSNDSVVNLSIVASGALVLWLGSNVPDLVIGVVVAGVAAHGGREILQEANKTGAVASSQ